MEDEQHTRSEQVQVQLDPDEALVLFELLSRWSADKDAATPSAACFESTAEGAALNALLCTLEEQLVEPFRPDYAALLEAARIRLQSSWDYPTLRG